MLLEIYALGIILGREVNLYRMPAFQKVNITFPGILEGLTQTMPRNELKQLITLTKVPFSRQHIEAFHPHRDAIALHIQLQINGCLQHIILGIFLV